MPESSPAEHLPSIAPFQPAQTAAGHCLSQSCTLPSGSPLLLWLFAPKVLSPQHHHFSHSSFPIPVCC